MLVIGITSRIKKGLSLFFWEYDNVSEYEALEEANYLSSLFDFDIYISESSPRHYHLISFDIMSVGEVDNIQQHTTFKGDYWTIKETGLYRDESNRKNLETRVWCALRVGVKGKKGSPRFIKAFHRGRRLKSLGHYRVFEKFCGYPPLSDEVIKNSFVLTDVELTIFNTGIGAKPKITPKNDRFR